MNPPFEPLAPQRPSRWIGIVVLAVGLLATAAFRWPLLVLDLIPARGDAFVSFLCFKALAAREVTAGRIPLWNPHLFCGQPFFADPQSAVFSPWTIPFYLLPLPTAFVVYILVKQFAAFGFMTLFLRGHRLGYPAAFLGALTFSMCSTLARQVWWVEATSPVVWLPLVLWLVDGLISRRRKFLWFLATVAGLAAINLAGHPQNAYYCYLFLGLYVVLRILGELASTRSWKDAGLAAGGFALACGLAGGIAACQVLPLQEFTSETRYRDGFSLEKASFPHVELDTLHATFLGGLQAETEPLGHTLYLGILPLLLLPLGVLFGRFLGAICLILAALAFTLGLGTDTPLFALCHEYLPLFRSMHAPNRILPVVALACAVLVALGFQRVIPTDPVAPPRRPRWVRWSVAWCIALSTAAVLFAHTTRGRELNFAVRNLIIIGPIALTLLAFLGTRAIGGRTFVLLSGLLVFLDLAHFSAVRDSNTLIDPDRIFSPRTTLLHLREDPGLFRSGVFTNGFRIQKRQAFDTDFFEEKARTLYPNSAMVFDTHDPQGAYSLKTDRYQEFATALRGDIRGGRWLRERLILLGAPFSPLYDLVNFKYVLTAERNPLPRERALVTEGDGFGFPPSPLASTGLLVEVAPTAEQGGPLEIEVQLDGADPVTIREEPRWQEIPAFSSQERLLGPPRDIGWSAPERAPWSEWTRESTEEGTLSGDRATVGGDGSAVLASPRIPFRGALEVELEAEVIDRDDTGIRIDLLVEEEDGRVHPLYGVLYGDEGLSAVHRDGDPRTGTRRFQTKRGDDLSLRFSWIDSVFTLWNGERRVVEHREMDLVRPEHFRLGLGARGGRITYRNVRWTLPEAGTGSVLRVHVPFPAPGHPDRLTIRTADGTALAPVSVYRLDRDKFTPVDEDGTVTVYRNERALPRAFLVGGHRVVPDRTRRLALLADPAFSPREQVLLEEPSGLTRDDELAASAGTATVKLYRADRIEIDTASESEEILFLSEAWHAGWQATVDGEEAPVLRANHAFRAVALSPGSHEVVFTYRPRSFRIGGAITLASLLVWLLLPGLWLLLGLRRRSAPPPHEPWPGTDP